MAWVEDPTNRTRATLRARLRAEWSPPDWAGAAPAPSTAASGRAERASPPNWPGRSVPPRGLCPRPGRLGPDALSALVWALSGRRYPPPAARGTPGSPARTLHGVLFRPPAGLALAGCWRASRRRSPARRRPRRRELGWALRSPRHVSGATIGTLGAEPRPGRAPSALPSMVRCAALPALRRGDELIACAASGSSLTRPCLP